MNFYDFEPSQINILEEVMLGMSKDQKSVPPKLLYDEKGSEIFEMICDLKEYYPTRAEKEILQSYAFDMAQMIGEETLIIEPGSGSGEKIRYLLKELKNPSGYVPIEISKEILLRMTEELMKEFPKLNVTPVCADFSTGIDLPVSVGPRNGKKVIFFPGSTIGNLSPEEAVHFLIEWGKLIPVGGGFIIGVDLKKNIEVLERAYDDSMGVTAAFNLNLLTRLNRELNATFDTSNFVHRAFYNKQLGRVEMHLQSKIDQQVKIKETIFHFKQLETIHTENSYKYTVAEFAELCAKAKLKLNKYWKDSKQLFCVYYFEKV